MIQISCLGAPETDDHDVCTRVVDDLDDLLDLLLVVDELHRGRVRADGNLATHALVGALQRLLGHAGRGAQVEDLDVGILGVVVAERRDDVRPGHLLLDRSADPLQPPVDVLAVGGDEVCLAIGVEEGLVALQVVEVIGVEREDHAASSAWP